MQQVLTPAGPVYVATNAAEVEHLKAEGIFFGVWVIDPHIEQDADWGEGVIGDWPGPSA
jgi:hypothetical protein